ncbi:MAG: helix-turn-helix domain-containing protein [Abditibacteriota bacterium]|nr:helix-turn-helix domain-containing protein [Abditibacteriota bacterium]
MAKNYKDFGDFLHQKRVEKRVSYRELAKILDMSAPYLSDIEKGRRNAPSIDKLEMLISYFGLSEEEKSLMFDLAGKKKDTIPPDIPDYIKERDYVAAALRTAKDCNAGKEEWARFIADLKKRKG